IAAMSMMSGKSFAIGEAGMMVTDNRDLYERCVAWGHYDRTGITTDWGGVDPGEITMDELKPFSGLPLGGYKHRVNQLCSALGLGQLQHYPARIKEIQKAMHRFWDLLEGVPGIRAHRTPKDDKQTTMGGWYSAKGLYRAEELGGLPCAKFCEAVRAEGVATCTPGANNPLHLHPFFNDADIYHMGKPTVISFGQRDVRQGKGSLPVSENINNIAFRIPWFKHDRPEIIEEHAAAFRKVAENAKELL
ncbi:MAG: DegT/DnrJ/EryC1/StrS family aminotransferase, partial [Planctomycetes bacterium]|nr:DegT/DnrJ/EryC1/StrS family aminotransferase [Planctomycetota bacterium]